MVFNSVTFLIFLFVVLALYYRLPFRRQNVLLLVASYVFYGWWDWRFLGLLLFSTFFDYWCALRLEKEANDRRKKVFLGFSMAVNLGVLAVFKYFNFFADSAEVVLKAFGFEADLITLNVVLPVGISFYTFLSMSYTIDVYRGHLPAAHSPVEYMLYVSFFPHLVAGPIVRAADLLPQCQRPRIIQQEQVINGIWLCLMGLVKKMVIADRLAGLVNWGFSTSQIPIQDANAWVVVYAFAFQVYGDFSGYSDIARGLAKIMGFELVHNFKAPYFVSNPAAFWQHWHISLSVWLRDYLYIPLGGNRMGEVRTYRNLMITMVLGGLWHGAGFAFIAWGLYHGLLLVIHRFAQSFHRKSSEGKVPMLQVSCVGLKWRRALTVIFFFHVTCIGWLLFRAGSMPAHMDQATVVQQYLHAFITLPSGISPYLGAVACLGALAMWFQWQHARMDEFSKWTAGQQAFGSAAALALIFSLGVFEGSSFIYFQF